MKYSNVLSIYTCLLCISLFSCNSGPKAEQSAAIDVDWNEIEERDTLYAIVDNNSFSYFVYRGQPLGFEYELLKDFCESNQLALILKQSNGIEEAFEMLQSGEGDILAYHLTITKERKQFLQFSRPLLETQQVLIQKKPDNWRKIKLHETNAKLVRKPSGLANKSILVRKGSSFVSRLEHLSDEIGSEINIIEDSLGRSEEELMGLVASGEIEFTVADNIVARLNQKYYPILDTKTPLSLTQDLAWGLRKNAPVLVEKLDTYIRRIEKSGKLNFLRNKYFKNRKAAKKRLQSDFASSSGGHISAYDKELKSHAQKLGWDWRLLTAVVYQESQFDPKAKSWSGATGLFQLMPVTAMEYGIDSTEVSNPIKNLEAGARYLKWLDKLFAERVPDSLDRQNFVLAAFNIGQGHVLDAIRLAKKHDKDHTKWVGHVAEMLALKSKPEYFKDPVVKSGYYDGKLALQYIADVQGHYQHYKTLFGE